MKHMSIKLRVTLWYTVLLVVIVSLVLVFMLAISGSVVESDAKSRLSRVVEQNADEVEYDDGVLEIDDDFEPYRDGVYSLVYSADGALLAGQAPPGFDSAEPLLESPPRPVQAAGGRFYLHDVRVTAKDEPDLWVRGIVSADESADVAGTIIRIAFVTLPLLVLLAVLGGYGIASRSFRPIQRINDAADEIGDGKDLSRRIDIGEGGDEIHRLAQTFNRMFGRLESSFQEERQFTSDASHELRTPTSVILAHCDYALEHARTEGEYRDSLTVIRRQATKMSRLIAQLLSFTRVERGVETGTMERTDLSELLTMLCEELSLLAEKDSTLHPDIQPGVYARVDRAMITRLVSNLVSNAVRYGREGGRVTVSLTQDDASVTIAVGDDGIGIARDQQQKIWRRFYQVDPARTAGDEGSMGLGLAMVKQIAQLHGGRVQVESELGQGSVFTVTLPKTEF